MLEKKQLQELSWAEFEELQKEIDTILIPIGSVEQEGPHLPLGVDTIVALDIANMVAEKARVIVAPPIWVGYSDWHSSFPGNLSLRLETLIQMLRELCQGFIEYGFKRLVFMNPHAGNETPISVVATELRKEHGAKVAMINLWALANEMAQGIEKLNEKAFRHGGEIMTSVMLALHPEMVDMNKAQAEQPESGTKNLIQKTSTRVQFKNCHVSIYRLSKEVTKSGVMGNPMGASKEKGEEIISRWVNYVTDFLKEF